MDAVVDNLHSKRKLLVFFLSSAHPPDWVLSFLKADLPGLLPKMPLRVFSLFSVTPHQFFLSSLFFCPLWYLWYFSNLTFPGNREHIRAMMYYWISAASLGLDLPSTNSSISTITVAKMLHRDTCRTLPHTQKHKLTWQHYLALNLFPHQRYSFQQHSYCDISGDF